MLCVIRRYIRNFVLGLEFSTTHSVDVLCPVGAKSATDVVVSRQDYGDFVWPDPMERKKFGFVRLVVVGVVGQDCELTDFQRFSLEFGVIVTFVFEKAFKDVLSGALVFFIGLVYKFCDDQLHAGCLDWFYEVQIKIMYGSDHGRYQCGNT